MATIQASLDHHPFETPMDTESQLDRWHRLLKGSFDINLGEVAIPERKPGSDRLIVRPCGITMERIIEVFRTEFTVSTHEEDLDGATSHERYGETYAIWAQETVEADANLAIKSANDIKAEGLTTETLPERLLHELVYYRERKEHLDVGNWTLCSGSRYQDGDVPGVGWSPGSRRLLILPFHPDVASPRIRAREVV